MIEDPWIILVTDRGRLGSSIHAVAGKRETAAVEYKQTLRPLKAMRFPTERTATNWARKLLDAHSLDRVFTVVKLGDRDLPKPARERVHTQLDYFDLVEQRERDREEYRRMERELDADLADVTPEKSKPCRSARKTNPATRKIGRSDPGSSGTIEPGTVANGAKPKTARPTRSRKAGLSSPSLTSTTSGPEASSLLNLAALCQRCHNRHDAPARSADRRARIEAANGQGRLFD